MRGSTSPFGFADSAFCGLERMKSASMQDKERDEERDEERGFPLQQGGVGRMVHLHLKEERIWREDRREMVHTSALG